MRFNFAEAFGEDQEKLRNQPEKCLRLLAVCKPLAVRMAHLVGYLPAL